MRNLFVAAVVAGSALGCNHIHGNNSGVLFGHLKDSDLVPSSPQFLINKKQGEAFKICLAKYMTTELPGVENELKTAVNIWAHYLGRVIPVTIAVADLPPPKVTQSSDDLRELYYGVCGDDFDVVVGKVAFAGSTVGETGFSFSFTSNADGTRNIVSFRRHLFIRDFSLTPDPTGQMVQWKSIAQDDAEPIGNQSIPAVSFAPPPAAKATTPPSPAATNAATNVAPSAASPTTRDSGPKPDSAGVSLTDAQIVTPAVDPLLTRLMQRSTVRYNTDGRALSLPVLVHEIGHIWGLCDQYESSNNCDPMNSSEHKVLDSIMGAASSREKLYLTDDDIQGIRALQKRPGFAQDWPDSQDLKASPVALSPAPVELFQMQSVVGDDQSLLVTYSVVTNVPVGLKFQVKGPDDDDFSDLGERPDSATPVSEVGARLRIDLGGSAAGYKVRLVLTITGGKAPPVVIESPAIPAPPT